MNVVGSSVGMGAANGILAVVVVGAVGVAGVAVVAEV